MHDLQQIMNDILEESYLLHLTVQDERGLWSAQLIFVYDEHSLYWKSEVSARHSQAILKNNWVSGSISPCQSSLDVQRGLQIIGLTQKLEGGMSLAELYQRKRGKTTPHILKETQSWYSLIPIEIDLTHEALFGYEKKRIPL